MWKRHELYLLVGIAVLFMVVVGEYIILQQVEIKKTNRDTTQAQSNNQQNPQTQVCQSYISAIPNSEQKQYLADVSEGFVAYQRGLIDSIENSITWKGTINKILLNETYKVRSCPSGNSSSCKDEQFPNISLIELKSNKTNFTDVPFLFSGLNDPNLLLFMYDEQGKDFIQTEFTTVANELRDYKGEVTIKRTTLFNPTRRIVYISQTKPNAE